MTSLFSRADVGVVRLQHSTYPAQPPFHPGVRYPECPFSETGPPNEVYDSVRQVLQSLCLDSANYGTAQWNPLGAIVRPGDKVVLKPNFLWHSHRYDPEQWQQVITHGSIIRAVVDYVLIALKGQGEVWIADGPQQDAYWDLIVSRTGVGDICQFFQSRSSVPVRLLDLRDLFTDVRGDVTYSRVKLPGDPAGGTVVDLAHFSRFEGHQGAGRYYGADYDQADTNGHHTGGRHEYRLAKTVASANVFINLPKVKTHKKVGVTLCLKNLVGINAGRNWLPHHTDGDPTNGGDQFPAKSLRNVSERWGIRQLQQLSLQYPRAVAPVFRTLKSVATPFFGHTHHTVRSGNWHGNDTCWRMVHDINRALLYTDGVAFPTTEPKRFFSIVDGVIGGDGDGPAAPDPVSSAFVLGGFNPVSVDCAVTRLMGFDPLKLAMLREAFAPSQLPLAPFAYDQIRLSSNHPRWTGPVVSLDSEAGLHFAAHFGWVGQIEWTGPALTRLAE